MNRAVFVLLILLPAGSASAQGELVCSETRYFESLHSDFIWTFHAVAGERYSFASERLASPYSISLCIQLGSEDLAACAEVEMSDDPARICNWEAPVTADYLMIQVHSGGTFAVTMSCGTEPEGCRSTPVQRQSWTVIKSLFR